VLWVGVDPGDAADPGRAQLHGWTPGVGHAVVLLGRLSGGTVEVADPAVGRIFWNDGALALLWRGRGVRLVRGDD
jgi:hypothetical protein